ncbi:hypothetical protein [Sphingobium sp.]
MKSMTGKKIAGSGHDLGFAAFHPSFFMLQCNHFPSPKIFRLEFSLA